MKGLEYFITIIFNIIFSSIFIILVAIFYMTDDYFGAIVISVIIVNLLFIFYYPYTNGMEFNPVKYINEKIADMKVSRALAIEQEKAHQQLKVDTLAKMKGEEK